MSELSRESVTRLERDVWVSAFGWAAAFGHEAPAYWAAVAVLQLRGAPKNSSGRVRPTAEFVAAIRRGVEEFESGEAGLPAAVVTEGA